MDKLIPVIMENQAWLAKRFADYAEQYGYLPFVSSRPEAWQKAIADNSHALQSFMEDPGAILEPRADQDYSRDPLAAYALIVARRHRARGVTLPMFLCLIKYCRRSFLDLVATSTFTPEAMERYRHLIDCFFDRLELGCCQEWCGEPPPVNEQLQREIARRTRVEEMLILLREAIESLPIGITISDLEGKIVYTNPADALMHGYTVEELLGADVRLFAQVTSWQPASFEKIRQFGVWTRETDNLRQDGSRFPVQLTSIAVQNSQKEPMAIITACEDITARKLAEDKLRLLNEKLEQRVRERTALLEASNRELEAFSYSVSHDLRAPLRSIDGFSRILLEDCADLLGGENREYLERISAAAVRMGQLIDDLLQLSRVSRSELHRERVDLTAMVRGIAAELHEREPARMVEFAIAEGVTATGDHRLLQVMLENLLTNAWKFTGREPVARILFGVDESGGEKVYWVRDNGVGFDMAHARKLFGAFQRLHSIDQFEGTGIGLATVERVISRHGGRVWADAAVDRGAAFFFTLPDHH